MRKNTFEFCVMGELSVNHSFIFLWIGGPLVAERGKATAQLQKASCCVHVQSLLCNLSVRELAFAELPVTKEIKAGAHTGVLGFVFESNGDGLPASV